MNELERLREQIAGSSHYTNVEKVKVRELIELWQAAKDFIPHSQSVQKPGTGYLKALAVVQEALVRLG